MNLIPKEDIERAIRREQIREFVKEEMAKEITDMTLRESELAYCKADAQATFDMYRRKVEKNMKMDNWNIYYAKNQSNEDVILIAHNLKDAFEYTKELNFSAPVYIAEADSRDKHVKASGDDCSVLTVTERTDGTACFATKKYAAEIKIAKEEKRMENNRWDLYWTQTECGNDRIIIAKTLDEAKKYAAERYEGYSEPVWLCEADKHDIEVKVNRYSPSTLWTSCTDTRLNIPGEVKYADAIAWLKYKLGIAIEPKKTGSIEVRYEDGHTRVFDDVEEYKEYTSPLGINNLHIIEADGKHNRIPLVWIKEYVVDMPNDKKLVKEKITVSREEMADIVAKMRELEERLKKIQEG